VLKESQESEAFQDFVGLFLDRQTLRSHFKGEGLLGLGDGAGRESGGASSGKPAGTMYPHFLRSWVAVWLAMLLAPLDTGIFVRGQGSSECLQCDTCGSGPAQLFFVNSVQSDCKTPGAMPARIIGSTFEIDFGKLSVQGDLVSLVRAQWNTFIFCGDTARINLNHPSASTSGFMKPIHSQSVFRVPINTTDVASAIAAMEPGVYDVCRYHARDGEWYNTRIKVNSTESCFETQNEEPI
jgi:hypothetical protein